MIIKTNLPLDGIDKSIIIKGNGIYFINYNDAPRTNSSAIGEK